MNKKVKVILFVFMLVYIFSLNVLAAHLTQREIDILLAEREYIEKINSLSENDNNDEHIKIYLNGSQMQVIQEPILDNGTTLVPMRSIFESLGFKTNWNSKTNSVQASNGKTSIKLTIGSKSAIVDGKVYLLSVEPKTINGNTMIPLRFVSESAGYVVTRDKENTSIYITNANSSDVKNQIDNSEKNYYEKLWASRDKNELITFTHPSGTTETLTRGQWSSLFSSFFGNSLATEALQEKYGDFYIYWYLSKEEKTVYNHDISEGEELAPAPRLTPDGIYEFDE